MHYKKIWIYIFLVLLGVWMGYDLNHETAIENSSTKIIEENSAEEKLQLINILNKEISIKKPSTNKITKNNYYSLDCKTTYYTSILIGGELIKDSYVKISEGSERVVLYVDGETAKYFGSDYTVLLDNSSYLVIMRIYDFSGLTETISINKDSGIGMDVKTLTFGASGQPISDTYILTCSQI